MAKDAFLSSLAEIPRQHGESAGRQAALQLIGTAAVRPETGPHTGAILAAALMQTTDRGRASGLPEAGLEQFSIGFNDGVIAVFEELQHRADAIGPVLARPAMRALARPLRPEDFGAMPSGRTSARP